LNSGSLWQLPVRWRHWSNPVNNPANFFAGGRPLQHDSFVAGRILIAKAQLERSNMQIGKPLRTIVIEPLELPVGEPENQPEPLPAPEPEPEKAPIAP
jgi:hypothetical protein